MASRIKGITVEIGGDTTGLEKALKNVIKTEQTPWAMMTYGLQNLHGIFNKKHTKSKRLVKF